MSSPLDGRPERAELLLIPGPVSVEDEVLEALAQPVRAHYGDRWTALYKGVVANLKPIFRTSGDVHLLFGSGMAGVEMCVGSVLSPGDGILIPSNGLFADRMTDVACALNLKAVTLRAGPREAITAAAVAAELDRNPGLRGIAVVHHETSIGVINEVREIAALARERGLLVIVDAISSLAGVELDMDAWGIDLCVAVGNKCLGGPIGVAPVAVGPRALEAIDDGRPKAAGWYLNLATWRHFTEAWSSWHPHPVTVPTNVIQAVDVAIRRVMERGLDEHMRRQAAARDTVREGLKEMGFEMLVPDEVASPVTTAVLGLPGMDVPAYMRWLLDEHGMRIGGGFNELAGRIFRVGHIGRAAEPEVVQAYLAATSDYLKLAGLGPEAREP
jgi:alanine-glyoxylate transaminase / serine-glyoxylate transaminase / serine-pyruvate transaminase